MFCCVPPRGIRITDMTLNDRRYPLINVAAAVRAISVENLTIPTTFIKAVSLGCIENGKRKLSVWNYVSCRFEFFSISFFKMYIVKKKKQSVVNVYECCSFPPETPKPQLCDLRLDNCLLQLGPGQKTGPVRPQQANTHTPRPVSTQINTTEWSTLWKKDSSQLICTCVFPQSCNKYKPRECFGCSLHCARGPYLTAFFLSPNRNSNLRPVVCQQSSCSFQAVPHLEEYNISVVVKDLLGEETESYRFSIRDRGQRSFKRQLRMGFTTCFCPVC